MLFFCFDGALKSMPSFLFSQSGTGYPEIMVYFEETGFEDYSE